MLMNYLISISAQNGGTILMKWRSFSAGKEVCGARLYPFSLSGSVLAPYFTYGSSPAATHGEVRIGKVWALSGMDKDEKANGKDDGHDFLASRASTAHNHCVISRPC